MTKLTRMCSYYSIDVKSIVAIPFKSGVSSYIPVFLNWTQVKGYCYSVLISSKKRRRRRRKKKQQPIKKTYYFRCFVTDFLNVTNLDFARYGVPFLVIYLVKLISYVVWLDRKVQFLVICVEEKILRLFNVLIYIYIYNNISLLDWHWHILCTEMSLSALYCWFLHGISILSHFISFHWILNRWNIFDSCCRYQSPSPKITNPKFYHFHYVYLSFFC